MASADSIEDKQRFFALLSSFDVHDENETHNPSESDFEQPRKRLRSNPPVINRSPRQKPGPRAKAENAKLPNNKNVTSAELQSFTTSPSRKRISTSLQSKGEAISPPVPLAPTLRNIKRTSVVDGISEENKIFTGLVFYFIPNNDIAKHRKLRIQSVIAHGATWSRHIDGCVSHVIVDANIDFKNALKAFPDKVVPKTLVVVKENWLNECLGHKVLRDPELSRFKLVGAPVKEDDLPAITKLPSIRLSDSTNKRKDMSESPQRYRTLEDGFAVLARPRNELDHIVEEMLKTNDIPIDPDIDIDLYLSIDEYSEQTVSPPDAELVLSENKGYHCMEKNDGQSLESNPNNQTIQILQEMATYYDRIGDGWRTNSYRKAITALRKQTEHIRTRSQALAIRDIGDRIADKIEEIVTTNRLRRLESASKDPDDQVLQLFMGIYDVGYVQARLWINQGYRTLDDLRKYAKLTDNHKVGIAHYDDFLKRIPRKEVEKHASIVNHALKSVDSGLQAVVGGSYRRGNADSGDIDILVTKEHASMEEIRTLMMESVVPELEKSGFLKYTFAATHSVKDDGSKWHGASALDFSSTWRRLDLLFVPWNELGAALIYFTGNDIFNRSIRLLASRKGMRLNQHGLYADVMRGKGRVRITDGTLLEGHSEKKIFEILGVPWRPPEHRKC